MKHNWNFKKLSAVCDRIGDGLHGTPNYVTGGEYYFVNGNNLKGGYVSINKDTKTVGQEEFEAHKVALSESTLLLSINGTIGEMALYRGEPIVLGKSAAYINCRAIDRRFCFYYFQLKGVNEAFYNIATGSTIKNLGLESLKKFLIPIPPRHIQEKIVGLLSIIDAKISLNNRISKELEGTAKLLYDYWFVQFDFPITATCAASMGKSHLEGKPYRSSGGKMIHNEALKREIPAGWRGGSLLDVATFTNGIACQKYPADGGETLRVIKIKDMRGGFSADSDLVSVKVPEKVKIKNGDLLFSWSASLEVMIWAGGDGALNQHIFKVTSDSHPRSFCYFVLLDYLRHFRMMADLRKTTMGHITSDHLEQSQIAIPDDAVAKDFEVAANPLLDRIVKAHEEIQQLNELRDWLLPMLMNGQITVS